MKPTIRVALFTSSFRGYWMLRFLTTPAVCEEFGLSVVGVATDDPASKISNAINRGVWKYGYDPHFEPELVPRLCNQLDLPFVTSSISHPKFVAEYQRHWSPDIAFVNVFGQRLPETVFDFPQLGTYNFHTTAGPHWPNFQGPDPLTEIIKAGHTRCRIACHRVEHDFDSGELHKFSEEVRIPPGASIADMQLMLAAEINCFLRKELPFLLGRGDSPEPPMSQLQPAR